MYAKLHITMDNAAFGNEPGEAPATQEVARILRDIAHKLEVLGYCGLVHAHDISGNYVGNLTFHNDFAPPVGLSKPFKRKRVQS